MKRTWDEVELPCWPKTAEIPSSSFGCNRPDSKDTRSSDIGNVEDEKDKAVVGGKRENNVNQTLTNKS